MPLAPHARGARRGPHLAVLAVALTLVGACRSAPAAPTQATVEPEPRPFTPGPRYSATFEAADISCRGFALAAWDGTMTLTIGPDHHATFELSYLAQDLYEDLRLRLVPPVATPPSEPSSCRWAGTGASTPRGWHASLERIDDTGSPCGGAGSPPLTLECRPDALDVPDASGRPHELPALRCAIVPPAPTLPPLLDGMDILLSHRSLHLELQRSTLGGTSRRLFLARPSPAAPRPSTTTKDLAQTSRPRPGEAEMCVER